MDENSIAGRTEKLRREIELIQHQENRYRRNGGHSLAKNLEHVKREFRVLQIPRDRHFGQRIARREWCVPPPCSAVASRVVRCVCSLRPILFDSIPPGETSALIVIA